MYHVLHSLLMKMMSARRGISAVIQPKKCKHGESAFQEVSGNYISLEWWNEACFMLFLALITTHDDYKNCFASSGSCSSSIVVLRSNDVLALFLQYNISIIMIWVKWELPYKQIPFIVGRRRRAQHPYATLVYAWSNEDGYQLVSTM